jgi:hypothetical protein
MVGLYLNFVLIFSRHHGFSIARVFSTLGMGEKLGRFEDIHSLPFRNLHIFVQRRSSHNSSVQNCRQTRILTPGDPIISPKIGREKAKETT